MITGPTPTENTLPLRITGFSTLAEALDYAAGGETGCNFYGDRGELYAVLPYAELREQARSLARRLMSLQLERGARVAIVADTGPDFQRFFFACQYAGLVPVPLSASLLISGRKRYVSQLRALLANCLPSVAMAPSEFFPFLSEAATVSSWSTSAHRTPLIACPKPWRSWSLCALPRWPIFNTPREVPGFLAG